MVSAIVTTYKREPDMVLRAIDSILMQTYKDMELIVVDDSPDEYKLRNDVKNAVLNRAKQSREIEIRYIAHEKNMGACVARNTGLNASRGEYVAYLDDDDEWMPEKIEKQIEVIQKSNVALVGCGSISVNDTDGTKKERNVTPHRGKVFKELLSINFIGSTSFPLIRKSNLIDIDGFDPLMQSVQDYDVWLRIAEKYEIDYIDEPLVIYHEHNDGRITTNPQKRINGTTRLCQKFQTYLDADRRLWWEKHRELSRQYALNGEYGKAVKNWWKCVCKCPEEIKYNSAFFYIIIQAARNQKNNK